MLDLWDLYLILRLPPQIFRKLPTRARVVRSLPLQVSMSNLAIKPCIKTSYRRWKPASISTAHRTHLVAVTRHISSPRRTGVVNRKSHKKGKSISQWTKIITIRASLSYSGDPQITTSRMLSDAIYWNQHKRLAWWLLQAWPRESILHLYHQDRKTIQ
jgi:hypothetical protein